MKRFFPFLLIVTILLSGCSKEEGTNSTFQSPLSDDISTRFEQIFYHLLDKPTIEEPDFHLNYSSSGASAPPSHSFKATWFIEEGLAQGAFYFIEPPYSDVSVGVERAVVRGIYDITYQPIQEIDQEAEKSSFPVQYDSTYLSFSLDYEEINGTLHDLVLTKDDSKITAQNIPLLINGTHIEADFSQVPKINASVGANCPFTLSGVLTYEGIDYPFKASF